MSGREDELVINPDDTNSFGNLAQPSSASSGRRRRSSPSDDSDWTLQLLQKQRQRTVLQFFFIVMLLISALVLGFFMHTSSQSEQQLTRELTILQIETEALQDSLQSVAEELRRTNATVSEESAKRSEAETKLAVSEASLLQEKAARTTAEHQRDQVKSEGEQAVQRSRDECNGQLSSTRSQISQEKQNLENQARDAQAAAQKAQAELKALQDAPKAPTLTMEAAVTAALNAVPPTNPASNPGAPAVVASFTPPADLLDRPLSALPSKARGIVVSFVHEDNIGFRASGLPQPNSAQLQACWDSAQTNLFTPHGLEWLLVYELWPADMTAMLRQFVAKNGWELEPASGDQPAPALWADSLHGARYLAPLPDNAPAGAVRTRITFHGHVLSLPRYLSAHPNLVDAKSWAPRRKIGPPSLLARRAFWLAGLWSAPIPALSGLDYAMKLALTTIWVSAPASNPIEAAAAGKCILAHDGIRTEWVETHEGAVEALSAYSARYGLTPASAGRSWCQQSWPSPPPPPSPGETAAPNPTEGPVWFQPSPFVVSLRWMRSIEVRHALSFWFEDEAASGFFRSGWGDVPLWPKLLCLHHDLAELNEQSGVCNFHQQWDIKPPPKL